MAQISTLKKIHRTSFFFRETHIDLEYNGAAITQDYVDEYDTFLKNIADDSVLSSKKMPQLKSHIAHKVTWLDLQDDDGKDIPVAQAIEEFDWDELIALDNAVAQDARRRQNPTPPTEPSASSG